MPAPTAVEFYGLDQAAINDFDVLIREPILFDKRYGAYQHKQLGRFFMGYDNDQFLYNFVHFAWVIRLIDSQTPCIQHLGQLLSSKRIRPKLFQDWFEEIRLGTSNCINQGLLSLDGERITIHAGTGKSLYFKQLPVLLGVFELLCGIDDMSHYTAVAGYCNALHALPESAEPEKPAVLTQLMRRYRKAHRLNNCEAYDRINQFLKQQDLLPQHVNQINDTHLLAYWQQRKEKDDDKLFSTVVHYFYLYCTQTVRANASIKEQHALSGSQPVNSDSDTPWYDQLSGEDVMGIDDTPPQSPLQLLDEEPARAIKFLIGPTLKQHTYWLDKLGAIYVKRWPLSVLRVLVFQSPQNCLIQSLRDHKKASPKEHLKHLTRTAYTDQLTTLGKTRDELLKIHLACLYGAGCYSDKELLTLNINPAKAKKAFESIRRQGFENHQRTKPERREGFRIGVGALETLINTLRDLIDTLEKINASSTPLEEQLVLDKVVFENQFTRLYGG